MPQPEPVTQRKPDSLDPSKLTVRQILNSMTLGQVWKCLGAVLAVLAAVATFSYQLGVTRSSPGSDERSAQTGAAKSDTPGSLAPSARTGPIRSGTIIATHYPTGELFAVDPEQGDLRLLSARLGQPVGLVIRSSGEIIVLDRQHDFILGVNPQTGHHRYIGAFLWNSKARAITLESDGSALVALDGAVVRVDLESGEATPVASSPLLRGASGIAFTASREIVVTTIPDQIVKVNPADGSTTVLSKGDRLLHPRAPIVENARSILLGTAGEAAGVIRVDLQTGAQELVVTGPFTTITGLAIESDGSILVADNGRGHPGDGFIARVDPNSRWVTILISAQTSGGKFLNGRSVAVFP